MHEAIGKTSLPILDYCSSLDAVFIVVQFICDKGFWFVLETSSWDSEQYMAGLTPNIRGWTGSDVTEYGDTAAQATAKACVAFFNEVNQ